MAQFLDKEGLAYVWAILKPKFESKVDKVDGKGLSTNDFTTTEKNALSELQRYIEDTLKGLIPTAATKDNQLADREFVNSSITTNTSTFRGTYESVANLPTNSTISDLRINDYAFVITSSNGNPEYQRYKYTTNGWQFEYTLNNSSFTAAQWSAIQSGITAALVEKLNGIQEGAEVNVQSDWNATSGDSFIKNKPTLGALASKDSLGKGDVGLGNVDNTSDANKPISTATQNALNQKANTSALQNYVDRISAQTIEGVKNFKDGIKLGNNQHGTTTSQIEIDGGVLESPNLNDMTYRGIYHCDKGTNTPNFDYDNTTYDLMVFNGSEYDNSGQGGNTITQMVIVGWQWWIRRNNGSEWASWERFGQATVVNSLTNAEIDTIFAS